MRFSPRRNVTAVPRVIATDALGSARSRLIAPDSLSSMNIRYRGHVRVTPQPTWLTCAHASFSRSLISLRFVMHRCYFFKITKNLMLYVRLRVLKYVENRK